MRKSESGEGVICIRREGVAGERGGGGGRE